jgi:hypothetical protein
MQGRSSAWQFCRLTGAAIAVVLVAGCNGIGDSEPFEPIGSDSPRERLARSGNDSSILDMVGVSQIGPVSVGSGQGRNEALSGTVNRHLWLASLDTLSFLPIASTDPFSGVIATDWGGVTDSELERFRVTAFVTSTTLAPESLRVAVHREVRQANGPWVTAPVAAETPRQIEDSILTRARQIRLEERGAS